MSEVESVLADIEKTARRRGLPIIGPRRGRILDEAVRESKARRILEVGTCVGYSAIRMARLLPDDGTITCIDIDPKIAEEARSNIERAGFSDRVEVLVGDAKKVMPTLEGDFDLVFLDAEKSEYGAYLKLAEEHLHKGSFVVADNVASSGGRMKDFLSAVRAPGRYSSRYSSPSKDTDYDGVEVSVRR